MSAGARNATIFQTTRRAAYRGEDFEALAYALNSECEPPLPATEVAGIVRSVEKFMREKYTPKTATQDGEPVPEALREFMAGARAATVRPKPRKPTLPKVRTHHGLFGASRASRVNLRFRS